MDMDKNILLWSTGGRGSQLLPSIIPQGFKNTLGRTGWVQGAAPYLWGGGMGQHPLQNWGCSLPPCPCQPDGERGLLLALCTGQLTSRPQHRLWPDGEFPHWIGRGERGLSLLHPTPPIAALHPLSPALSRMQSWISLVLIPSRERESHLGSVESGHCHVQDCRPEQRLQDNRLPLEPL